VFLINYINPVIHVFGFVLSLKSKRGTNTCVKSLTRQIFV